MPRRADTEYFMLEVLPMSSNPRRNTQMQKRRVKGATLVLLFDSEEEHIAVLHHTVDYLPAKHVKVFKRRGHVLLIEGNRFVYLVDAHLWKDE